MQELATESPEEILWNRRYEPHIAEVNELCDSIKEQKPGSEVLYIDPAHSMDDCRIVSLFSNQRTTTGEGFITPGDEAVIPVPTYAFFETQVRLNGGVAVLVPTTADLGFDIPAIRAAVTPRTKLIFLCSPNNPIGRSWTEEEVVAVLETGIPTVIDQAYLECGYGRSFAPLISRFPNLIVTRTMSKAYGLAAVRVGYGLADPAVIDLLLRVRIPFSVSLVGARACLAAVREPGYLDRRRGYISDERDRLFAVLSTLPGVVPWPSETNFITIDVTATGRPSSDYVAEAKAEHLLLRRVAAHRLEGQYVRVTIGTIEENDRFLEVFSRSVPGAETPGADPAAR